MSRLFEKKSKKLPQPSQTHISLGIATNVAAGPLGFRAELDIGPKDRNDTRASRVVFIDKKSEDQGPPALETSITETVLGDEHGNGPTTNSNDAGKEESEQAVASRVAKSDWKDTEPGGTAVLFDAARDAAETFGPLKAALGAISVIYETYDDTAPIRSMIKGLHSRVAALEATFGVSADDVAEMRRRDGLLRKFKHIAAQLRSLSERSGLQRFGDQVQDDDEVYGLLGDLREAINDYRMVQQVAIYDQGCKLINAAEMSVLNNFRSSQAAEYRHGGRQGCLKGTRGAVLDEIESWTRDFERPPVYWLNGLAGTGKTAIAQTTAERTFADGQLGASFFCSRDFEDRSNLEFIFPTIAVQLATRYPEFRSIFIPLVQPDPRIAYESLYNQMEQLIVGPLKESGVSTVIVIDALDECKDEEPASAILSVLGQFVSQIPKVKFFVTGRPERRILAGFRLPQIAKATDVYVLHEVEPIQVDKDIRLFLRHKFSELADLQGGLDGWPTEDQLNLLCERAAGLFVYAVATVKFVAHRNNDPKEQLDRLLQSPENTAHEGKTKFKPNTTLDSLYMTILQEAFGDDADLEDDRRVRSVLGAVILAANPLSPSTIAALLGLHIKGVFLRLASVHSLLILQEDINHPVRVFHRSFPDFIVDPTRCINQRFHVSPPDHHSELLIGCLELMNQRLERNMCKLPDGVTNNEVDDLRERAAQYIDHGLQYACASWHKHLIDACMAPAYVPKITSVLCHFLENSFLFWLEVLSVLGTVRDAVDALKVVAMWLEVSPALDLINDCFRFVTGFFEVISTSASHIYHSALLLSPRTSIVRRLYKQYTSPLARIVQGEPMSWEQSIAAMKFPSLIGTAAWSPCSKFIAIAWGGPRTTIEILDAVTLGQLKSFVHPQGNTQSLNFSPESRLLTWISDKPEAFISWDLQTGVLVSAISPERPTRSVDDRLSVTYSACGNVLGVLFHGDPTFTISTYEVLSGTHISSHLMEGPALDEIWTHDKCFRFATTHASFITTWEVEFTSTHPPTEVGSLPIPGDSHRTSDFFLHPTLSRLAFIAKGNVKVWDARSSKFLLDSADVKLPRHFSFSLDGHFLACGTSGPEFYLWKESPSGYILHRNLTSRTKISKPLISPNGESIIAFGNSVIQLWHTTDPTTPLSTVSTRASQNEKHFIMGFSPDETLAAVTRMGDETVTVLELESGISRLIIDTGMKIYGLGVAGSTVVVVCDGKIVTWKLPTGNDVLNPRASVNDSVRTTPFEHPPFPTLALRPTTSVSPDLHYIAIVELDDQGHTDSHLHLYNVHTGQCLASVTMGLGTSPWFTLDGSKIWCVTDDDGETDSWGIVKESGSDVTRLEHLKSTTHLPDRFPWQPSPGYDVVDGLWVVGAGGKRLLWLPPHWRSGGWDRMWGGRFLALLDCELPEPVILELLG